MRKIIVVRFVGSLEQFWVTCVIKMGLKKPSQTGKLPIIKKIIKKFSRYLTWTHH